jgi:phage-related protein
LNPVLKRLPARFYRAESGREPVREWLKTLEAGDRKAIGEDIKDVEFSRPLGMPLVRALGNELWEVRPVAGRPHRSRPEQMLLLHGFIKKTQRTPKREIDLALKRKKGESS